MILQVGRRINPLPSMGPDGSIRGWSVIKSVCGVQTTSKLIHKLTPRKQGRCMCIRWLFKPLHVMFRVTEAAFFCFVLGVAFFWMRFCGTLMKLFLCSKHISKWWTQRKDDWKALNCWTKRWGFHRRFVKLHLYLLREGFSLKPSLRRDKLFRKRKLGRDELVRW